MRFPIFLFLILIIHECDSQSSSPTVSSTGSSSSFSPSTTSKYDNSSPSSSFASSSTQDGSTEQSASSTTDSSSLDLDSVEKLVTYTTKQKTIFIACCGGTFVLLIALAILSGLSDTIARSHQKTKRTHA